ncbi:MAG: type III pantothenate kinase [Desulfobulbaceae bacterium]|nr:type III pantothenate kinase [Desulfobulbaceae bacterium]
MLLAIDIGNTNTVIGLFTDREIASHWRLQTDAAATADELATALHGLFNIEGYDFAGVAGVIIASVVPVVQTTWTTMARKYFGVNPLTVDSCLKSAITVKTTNPAEVGADRIVNAVAGFERYHTALIIIDFGTAITCDCVSSKGKYLGGAIAPGLGISLEALTSRTAKLPRVDISTPPPHAIGTNTGDAIKSGLLFGCGGMVEELVRRMRLEMAPEIPTVIATGGMAGLIAPYVPSIKAVLPMLTLEGLRLLHERNR